MRSAEEHVLACCFLDDGVTLERAAQSLTPSSFHHPEHAIIFRQLVALHAEDLPLTLESLAENRGEHMKGVNTMLLLQLTDPAKYPTTAHAGTMIARVADAAHRRQLEANARYTLEALARGVPTEELPRALQTTPPGPSLSRKPLFTLTVPPADDDSIILGNRYLNKGDGAVLSSSSGMGKSAMAIQMAARWSLEMDAFGIKPRRALRILIIQSEDSEGDVAEVTGSIAHMMHLTPAQVAQINTNVVIVTDRVNRGTRFIAQLKLHIANHRPDLVIINPLQAFIDGDITASQDLGAFLREGLNGLNEPAQFAYLLIHHTTKPATGKERNERLWHEVMYDMAGGAELINWARAVLSLRATATEGEFNLVLAKRGKRAGVTREVEQGVGTRPEAVTTIPLKHASGTLPSGQSIIYWEPRTTPDSPTITIKGGGRPSTHLFTDYRAVFPPRESKGMQLGELHKHCYQQRPISRQALHTAVKRWAEQGDVEVLPQPNGQSDRYRAAL